MRARLLLLGFLVPLISAADIESTEQLALLNDLLLEPRSPRVTMSSDGSTVIRVDHEGRARLHLQRGRESRVYGKLLPTDGHANSLHWIDAHHLLAVWNYSTLRQGFVLISFGSDEQPLSGSLEDLDVKVIELHQHDGTRLSQLQLVSLTRNHVYYSLDERRNGSPGLFRIDWQTGHQRPYRANPGQLIRWFHDPRRHTLMGWFWDVRDGDLHYQLKVLRDGAGLWDSIAAYDLTEPEIRVLGFSKDGLGVNVARETARDEAPSATRGRIEIKRIPFLDPRQQTRIGIVDAPMVRVLLNEQDSAIEYAEFNGLRPTREARSDRWQGRLDLIAEHDARASPSYVIDSSSRSQSLWRLDYAHQSSSWVLVNDENGRVQTVTTSHHRGGRPDQYQQRQLMARDGLLLDTFISLPEASTRQPVPAVLLVHGGPWFRDDWQFREDVEFLRQHGLAVIRVNYRGSRGLGHSLFMAGREQWGLGMQSDLEDVRAHLAQEGLIDARRTCVMGNSYGGYAALMAVMRPDHPWRCAVAYAPVSDLARQIRSFRADYHFRAWHEWQIMVGEVTQRSEFLDPLSNATQLDAPVLVVHGTADHRVRYQQSQILINELERHEKDFEFVPIEGGQHVLNNPQNRLHYYQKAITFLTQHLQLGDTQPTPTQRMETLE